MTSKTPAAQGNPEQFHYCAISAMIITMYCSEKALEKFRADPNWVSERMQNRIEGEGEKDGELPLFASEKAVEMDFLTKCASNIMSEFKAVRKVKGPGMGSCATTEKNFTICNDPLLRALGDLAGHGAISQCMLIPGVRNGLYDFQLLEWVRTWPEEQLLVMDSDTFYKDTPKALAKIEDFLGISNFDQWDTITKKVFNVLRGDTPRQGLVSKEQDVSEASAYKPMSQTTRDILLAGFRPSMQRLEVLIGEKCPWLDQ